MCGSDALLRRILAAQESFTATQQTTNERLAAIEEALAAPSGPSPLEDALRAMAAALQANTDAVIAIGRKVGLDAQR